MVELFEGYNLREDRELIRLVKTIYYIANGTRFKKPPSQKDIYEDLGGKKRETQSKKVTIKEKKQTLSELENILGEVEG